MARRKGTAPVGQARVSEASWSADPRGRKNAGANLQTPMNHDRTLDRDSGGRLGIKPARAVKVLAAEASLEDVVAKLNEIIKGQRSAGHMEGGH